MLFRAVYIPPESSSYSAINLFDDLEEDIISLLGDFKAHTSNLQDFVCVNERIYDNFNFNDITKQMLN